MHLFTELLGRVEATAEGTTECPILSFREVFPIYQASAMSLGAMYSIEVGMLPCSQIEQPASQVISLG